MSEAMVIPMVLATVVVGTLAWLAFEWLVDKLVLPMLGYAILAVLCYMFWPLLLVALLVAVLVGLAKLGATGRRCACR